MSGEALREWKGGWPLVLTAVFGTTAVGAHVYSLGVMMKPLSEAFGWSRAGISAATMITSLATIALIPAIGLLVDKFGPRRVALIGVPLSALAMGLVAFSMPSMPLWMGAWALYATFAVTLNPVVWVTGVAPAFKASRGLAFGIAVSGSGVSAAIYPILALWLFSHFGLRGVYPGLGLATLLVLFPMVVFLFKPPRIDKTAPEQPAAPAGAWGWTAARAVRTFSFWRIAILMAVAAMVTSGVITHLPPLLTDGGLTPGQAVGVAAIMGPSVLAGRWLGGWLLDRVHGRWVAFASLLAPAVGCVMLLNYDGDYSRAVIATLLVGLASGVEGDLLPFLLSRYFGPRHFGAIYGMGMAMFAGGYALAPMAAGALFDATGSYDLTLSMLAILLTGAALLAISLGRYPPERDEEP